MNWITTWEQIFCILFIWQTNFEPEKSASRTFLLLKPGSFSPPGSWREGMWCPPRLPMLKRLPWMSYVYAKLFAGVLEFKWFGIQRNVLFSQRFVDTSLGVGKTCSKSITSFKWSPIVACFLSSLTLEPLSIFHPPFSLHSQITPPHKKKTGRVCVSFQRFRGTLLSMELISESHKRFGGSKVQEAIAHIAFVPAETFTNVQHRHVS